MPTPHKHAEVIKAWADGQQIEQKRPSDPQWETIGDWPGWNELWSYRIKPAAPKWPLTTLPEGLLVSKWFNGGPVRGVDEKLAAMWRIVNAGIEYECSIGALVPADKVREIEAKARAEGMKEGAQQEHERIRLMAQFASPVGGQLVGYQVGNLK